MNFKTLYCAGLGVERKLQASLWLFKETDDGELFIVGGMESELPPRFISKFIEPPESFYENLDEVSPAWEESISREVERKQSRGYRVGTVLNLKDKFKKMLEKETDKNPKDIYSIVLGNGQSITALTMSGVEFILPKPARRMYQLSQDALIITSLHDNSDASRNSLAVKLLISDLLIMNDKIKFKRGSLGGGKELDVAFVQQCDFPDTGDFGYKTKAIIIGLDNIKSAISAHEERSESKKKTIIEYNNNRISVANLLSEISNR